VLHFDGHGVYDRRVGLGGLCFEDPNDSHKLTGRRHQTVYTNQLGPLLKDYRIPLVVLVTMRGEWGEFNPWQVPMSRATQGSLALMGVSVRRVDEAARMADAVQTAIDDAFLADQPVAILIGQRMLGRKQWLK
jgi:sulfopyruvate decarboxylase TPP-binding subunit